MAARPPPARPHIGLNPSFQNQHSGEWGEDDAWDSGSDSESPRQSTIASSWLPTSRAPSVSATSPKPVPKSPSRPSASSSTLGFSYTHVNAPSPSSYPPRVEQSQEPPQKSGWTIVRKSTDGHKSVEEKEDSKVEGAADDPLVEDMVVGSFEPEVVVEPPAKPKVERGSIREDVDDIVTDPLHGIRHRLLKRAGTRGADSPDPAVEKAISDKLIRERSIRTNRRHKFVDCLSGQDVNIAALRKLAWAGVPNDLRPMAWQLLLGYLPLPTPLRASTLARKRGEYLSLVELAFARDREGLDQQIWHQIEIDVPRTRPGVPLWMQECTQRSLERILYVWAIRHPASGYVQGINDLVTPFFQIFLSAYIADTDPEEFDLARLPKHVLDAVEADSFWCLSRLLDGIQDNYIHQQPGIHRSVRRMAELVARIDAPLAAHLEAQNVEFMQFAFRWMNCLLMREISVKNTIRMWDTYLAEGPDAFSQFHLYVCSAFLVKWSEKLRQMDFQGIIMFLQSLPTQDWDDHEIEMLLSEAFVLNSIWHNAQSHFNGA
ncbi:RabGAP/TBC [Athelia psychrophila]|uniref:RabGAP/TBC n=1 Tax=Athelia psychrophila TaxID=1759441 RepID=A0A166KXQ9_9AGAM|nr:RabGAP/TBC [Fibularhizoctonia sp. CBS 109695]